MNLFLLLFLFVGGSLFSSLAADELTVDPPKIWQAECSYCRPPADCFPCEEMTNSDVIVDLRNPIYENGILMTEEGGVLRAPGIRIQAQNITYTRTSIDGQEIGTVFCSGNLLVDYGKWVFIGDAFYYDFMTQSGFLLNGKTAAPPWYIGGREFLLFSDACVLVLDGYVTTSEGTCQDVMIRSPRLTLTPKKIVTASNLTFRVKEIPLLWLPHLEIDLKNVGRSPLALKFGWGGFLGSYLGISYRLPSWGEFHTTARADAFFGHGLGFGLETAYDPKCAPTRFFTRNYVAQDIALLDPIQKSRYRFQGTFYDCYYGISIDGMYDVVSDPEMATEYQTKDFELKTAGRTQIDFRKQETSWIAKLFTRVRVNDFQSVNQELPSFYFHLHPFEIFDSGVIAENTFKASYLNYVFSDDVNAEDFHAGRIATTPRFYRPFHLGPTTFTPEAALIGIAYSNSFSGKSVGQVVGDFGATFETAFSKRANSWKHVIEPYAGYHLLTFPRVPLGNYYIFTINDGYDKLNLLRLGIRNSFFTKFLGCLNRPLWLDLWTNAFLDTATIENLFPKAYCHMQWQPFSRLFWATFTAWNFQEKKWDFFNTRLDFTVNENLAFGVEYRTRSAFDWRKADFYNFILESTRTTDELLDSALSDKRNTFLFRIFMRPLPDWTAKFSLRNGWNRPLALPNGTRQKPYLEYQIELGTILFEHWALGFNYERREGSNNRFSFSLKLEPGPPSKAKACRPCL